MEIPERPTEEQEVARLIGERERIIGYMKSWIEAQSQDLPEDETSVPVVIMFVDNQPPYPLSLMPIPSAMRTKVIAGLNHMGIRAVMLIADAKKKDVESGEQIGSGLVCSLFLPDGGILASFLEYSRGDDGKIIWQELLADAPCHTAETIYDKAWRKEIKRG